MNQLSIQDRVKRLKKQFEVYANDPDYKFTLKPVSSEEISLLKSKEYFPPDMLMILEDLGCMRKWGYLEFAMIDWWIPSSIERSIAEDRSVYDI